MLVCRIGRQTNWQREVGGGGHRKEKIVSWSVPTVSDHVANVLIRVIVIVTFSTATTGKLLSTYSIAIATDFGIAWISFRFIDK